MARPARLSAFDYVGLHRYLLTICTHDRFRWFCDADLVGATLALFLQQAEEKQFALLAYCFMPDHVHLLVEGLTDTADLRAFINAAKQQSGYQFAQRQHRSKLWQKGYHERVLRTEDSTNDIARYILANPVRAGLVREPHEYEFSGSTVFDRDQLDEIWWHR
jgi:putative transposase